jgi:protein ImuB
MQLWIGLHLSHLPLEVFHANWSSDSVAVVLDQDKALGISRAARAAGIKPGMRRGGVLMLQQDALIHERCHQKEAEAIGAVAMAMLQYTPEVAEAEESTILLSVGASLKLFGGIRSLCRRVRSDLRALGFTGRVSCAPTARGAWLLARCGGRGAVKLQTMVRRLDNLPALAIPAARAYRGWFEGLGCETIAHLRRLPRPGLQRRCGRQLLDTIDSAMGSAPEIFEWIEPPTTFEARIELFDRIENAELLLAGAQRLVIQLVGFLCARQLAVEQVTLLLFHERGRQAGPPTEVQIVLSEAVWEGDHIIRLLKERLNRLELDAPTIELALQATKLQPMAPQNDCLFPEPGASEEDQAKCIELMVARLGDEAVRQSNPTADYRPEEANTWVSVQETLREAAVVAQLPPNLGNTMRPAWLLATPIALLIRSNRPFYGSALRIVDGPERVEAGWWSEGQARDYYVAQDEAGSLLWIYLERLSSSAESGERRYFLHGLFG